MIKISENVNTKLIFDHLNILILIIIIIIIIAIFIITIFACSEPNHKFLPLEIRIAIIVITERPRRPKKKSWFKVAESICESKNTGGTKLRLMCGRKMEVFKLVLMHILYCVVMYERSRALTHCNSYYAVLSQTHLI